MSDPIFPPTAQPQQSAASAATTEALARRLDEIRARPAFQDDPITRSQLEGLTLGQAIGLTRDDMEVLYTEGFRLLTRCHFEKARVIFAQLALLDPLVAKNHYCHGVALQQLGLLKEARETLLLFLTLDATNPEGLLRLGECHLALGETTAARAAFELALAEAERGHGSATSLGAAQARLQMIDTAPETPQPPESKDPAR